MAFFKPASRKKCKGRIAFCGGPGDGKTFTALRLAHALGSKIAVINSESGAVEKYLGLNPDGIPWDFCVHTLTDFSPTAYTTAILEAAREGFEVVVIDSLSHAWAGAGGALELVDKKGGNKFTAWKDVTPMHNRMVDAILRSPCHLIATMRSKMEYVVEEFADANGRTKSAPRRIGMAPVQRQGVEYEFDVVGDMDNTHTLTISKSRCPDIDGACVVKPGAEFFTPLVRWLNEGSEVDPGFYIASEADLERSERAKKQREAETKKAERQQEAAAKAAEKEAEPKVDAKELIRRKAAERAAAQQAVADHAALPDAHEENLPGDNGDTPAESAAANEEAATATAATTEAAAGEVGGSDEAVTTAMQVGEPPFDTADSGTPEPQVMTGPSNGPCTDVQVNQIKAMLAELSKDDPTIGDKVKKALAAQGMLHLSDLTRFGAEELLRKLYQKAAGERLTKPAKAGAKVGAAAKN